MRRPSRAFVTMVILLALATGCGKNPHRYDEVNAIAVSLHLDTVGTTTNCVNHPGASFSNWTYCQVLVTAPDAAAKVADLVRSSGYSLVVRNVQRNQTVWERKQPNHVITITIDALRANSSYTDLDGHSHSVPAESALVQVQLA